MTKERKTEKEPESSQQDATEYFKIRPPELPPPKDEYVWCHPPLPKCDKNTRLLLIGASGTGKTNVFKNLVERYWVDPNTGRSVFDIILIFSPTLLQDPLYEIMFNNPILKDLIIPKLEIDRELLLKLLNRKEDNLKILIFLDDFAYNKKVFELPEVVALYMRGRHANILPIISSQFYFSVDSSIRVNSTGMMIFRLKRANEKQLLRIQLSTPRVHDEIFDAVLDEAHKENKHDFLYCDIANQRFYKNFEYELAPDSGEERTEDTEMKTEETKQQPEEDEIDRLIREEEETLLKRREGNKEDNIQQQQ